MMHKIWCENLRTGESYRRDGDNFLLLVSEVPRKAVALPVGVPVSDFRWSVVGVINRGVFDYGWCRSRPSAKAMATKCANKIKEWSGGKS